MKLHVKSTSFSTENGQTSRFSFFTVFLTIKTLFQNISATLSQILFYLHEHRVNYWRKMLPWTILEQFPVRNVAASIIGNGVILLLWQLRCYCNPDHNKFSSLSNTTVVVIFPNICLWWRSLCSKKLHRYWPWKTVSSHLHMLVRPMLLHRMALVSVRLFCKNLGNLQEFFGQMVYRPPWQKISRTPMSPKYLRHTFQPPKKRKLLS